MRLLHVRDRKLRSFEGSNIPKYAILSHRWDKEEVLFGDIEKEHATKMKGYYKIDMCCQEAARAGIDYVWVDTCCIDKSSSAELSEAINSMYQWYAKAVICYAYLNDVTNDNEAELENSAWFTRGWTLQELLAPNQLMFFDRDWVTLGSKNELSQRISGLTGIPKQAVGRCLSALYSVAEKMSWASKRKTTREEDRAYSLFGLFNVHMPLIYGEGSQAFSRLQQHIINTSDDPSAFMWSGTPYPGFGLLAASPAAFRSLTGPFQDFLEVQKGLETFQIHKSSFRPCFGFDRLEYPRIRRSLQGFTLSSAGIYVQLVVMIPWSLDIYLAILDKDYMEAVITGREPQNNYICGMFLLRHGAREGEEEKFSRVSLHGNTLGWTEQSTGHYIRDCRDVLICRNPMTNVSLDGLRNGFLVGDIDQRVVWELANDYDHMNRYHSTTTLISQNAEAASRSFLRASIGQIGIFGIIFISSPQVPSILIHIGFDEHYNPVCLVSRAEEQWAYRFYSDVRIKHPLANADNLLRVGHPVEIMDRINNMTNRSSSFVDDWQNSGVCAFRGSWRRRHEKIVFNGVVITLAKRYSEFAYRIDIERQADKHGSIASDFERTAETEQSVTLRNPDWVCTVRD